jgi:ribosome recycling factor
MLKYSHKANKGEFEYMNTEVINLTEEKMNKTLDNLEHRFVTVRAGRANPSSLDGITADYYGSPTPLKQLATISVPEARQLLNHLIEVV